MIRKLLILLPILTIINSIQWYEEDSPIFLNPTNYDQTIQSNPDKYKFVKFFTPFCKYCRILKDNLKQIKNQHHRDDILFYDFNCHQHPTKCTQLKIYYYPHVIVYGHDGKQIQTISGYSPIDIVRNFMERAMPQIVPNQKNQLKQKPKQTIVQNKPQISPKDKVEPPIIKQQIKIPTNPEVKDKKSQNHPHLQSNKVEHQINNKQQANNKKKQEIVENKQKINQKHSPLQSIKVEPKTDKKQNIKHDQNKNLPQGTRTIQNKQLKNTGKQVKQKKQQIKVQLKQKKQQKVNISNNKKIAKQSNQNDLSVPNDIQEKQQKEIEKTISQKVKTQQSTQKQQHSSQSPSFIKIGIYLLICIFGGYYFYAIMKNNQITQSKTLEQQGLFDGELRKNNNKKVVFEQESSGFTQQPQL